MSQGMQPLAMRALSSEYWFEQFVQEILLRGYNATVDAPCHFFALRLAKRFPAAKVLLGVRDTPEQWAASFHTLMNAFRFVNARPFRWIVPQEWYSLFSVSSVNRLMRFGLSTPDQFFVFFLSSGTVTFVSL
jgi:hypothetical protein